MCTPSEELIFKNEELLSNFVNGKTFRCMSKFLPWLKIGKEYTLEYIGSDEYIVKEEKDSRKQINMNQNQLVSWFIPKFVEEKLSYAIVWGHWLGSHGIYPSRLDFITDFYKNTKTQILDDTGRKIDGHS